MQGLILWPTLGEHKGAKDHTFSLPSSEPQDELQGLGLWLAPDGLVPTVSTGAPVLRNDPNPPTRCWGCRAD